MSNDQQQEACQDYINGNGWSMHVCGRPVKRDGRCGIHAAAADRARANEEKRVAERERRSQVRDEVLQFLDQHGIQAGVHYDRNGDVTGMVVISQEELLRLLER